MNVHIFTINNDNNNNNTLFNEGDIQFFTDDSVVYTMAFPKLSWGEEIGSKPSKTVELHYPMSSFLKAGSLYSTMGVYKTKTEDRRPKIEDRRPES